MSADDKHAGNVILLRVACISLLLALVLAWCLVFTNAIQVQAALDIFKDTDKLLSAHLDFLMMTMLLLGFYASKITLPLYVVWPMAIGSITNPTCFLLESLFPGSEHPAIGLFIMVSIVIATFGYGMGAIKVMRATLR